MLGERDLDRIWFGCGNFGGIGSAPELARRRRRRRTGARAARSCAAAGASPLRHRQHLRRRRERDRCSASGFARRALSFLQGAQIATKVGNPHGCPPGETPLSRTQIARHLDQSLRRLGVERIDLYYIHEFDRVTPLEETLEAMTRAVEAGKIDRFGVSNASLADVKAVRSLAGDQPRRAASNMSRTSTICSPPRMREALIPYCADHGLRYTAFSPLAGGLLTGKYRFGAGAPARQPPGRRRRRPAPPI